MILEIPFYKKKLINLLIINNNLKIISLINLLSIQSLKLLINFVIDFIFIFFFYFLSIYQNYLLLLFFLNLEKNIFIFVKL
jgi:hypothetical protein